LNLSEYVFALTAFEHAYEIDPEWPATQYFLGLTYDQLDRNEDAIVYFSYSLNNGFEQPGVVKQKLADLYFEVENYEKAVKLHEELLALNRSEVGAFVRPIWLYLDFLDEPQKAYELAELAVKLFPENAEALNLLGWSQTGTGELEAALTNLTLALDLDPTLASAHYNLGKLYEEQKETQKALDSYKKAYDLDGSGNIGNVAAKRYNALLTK